MGSDRLDADTKLVVSYPIGGRDAEYAMCFMDDLRGRLANRVQPTADGHKAYLEAEARETRVRGSYKQCAA